VLVRQPALRCTRCGGDGKPHTRQVLLYSPTVCIVCHGTGWVMTADA
jgi:DnaJ-class molecular chaperone